MSQYSHYTYYLQEKLITFGVGVSTHFGMELLEKFINKKLLTKNQ